MSVQTNDLDELIDLVRLHARAQGLTADDLNSILPRITHDETGPGSWVEEWMNAARDAHPDTPLAATRFANLARFPYVNCEERAAALQFCRETFTAWAEGVGAERHIVSSPHGTAVVWTSGSVNPAAPVLLVIGGIVSIKEQWGQMLPLARRLRITIAVTEAPGVGENSMSYVDTYRTFVSDVLDEIGVDAGGDVRVLGLSFSLMLAVHAAVKDTRIRAIATVGGPVREFFEDEEVWARVPRTTADTWASILGVPSSQARQVLQVAAPKSDLWRELRIPVAYVASAQDEIVPVSEVGHLNDLVLNASFLIHDDVHGAPSHLGLTRLWLLGRLLAAPGPYRGKIRGALAGAAVGLIELTRRRIRASR